MVGVIDLTLEQKKKLMKEMGLRADELVLSYVESENNESNIDEDRMIIAYGKTYSPS